MLAYIASIGVACAQVTAQAGAHSSSRPYRVGVVTEAAAANHPVVEGLKAGLRELGLDEGRHVVFDIRFTQGRADLLPAAADALVKAPVDLIVTSGTGATVAARAATQTLPVVFTMIGDPVAAGVVKDVARPGGNLTGISNVAPELTVKRLELLKAIQPATERVWLVYAGEDAASGAALDALRDAALRFRVQLVTQPVSQPDQIARVLRPLKKGDALLVPDDNALDLPAALLAAALAAKVPAVFPSAFWVGYGGLASYGSDSFAQGMQAARMVAKIRRGAAPGDLAVEPAEGIELAVNLRTAGALGITVPPRVLLRADTIRR